MMDFLHSKTSTHLEDGLNQQSNSTTKKNVAISIIVSTEQTKINFNFVHYSMLTIVMMSMRSNVMRRRVVGVVTH